MFIGGSHSTSGTYKRFSFQDEVTDRGYSASRSTKTKGPVQVPLNRIIGTFLGLRRCPMPGRAPIQKPPVSSTELATGLAVKDAVMILLARLPIHWQPSLLAVRRIDVGKTRDVFFVFGGAPRGIAGRTCFS